MTRAVRGALPGLLLIACPATAAEQLAISDAGSSARAEAQIADIDRQLRTSDSATLTLERWCQSTHMADPARITVERDKEAASAPSAAQRALLGIPAGEPVRYRRVRLVCGGHVLSEAENWYVPGRLTAAMNDALESSDEPFGKVIRPLAPSRRTLSVQRSWLPPAGKAGSSTPCDSTVFSHEALVIDGKGNSLALVAEHYKMALLCGIGTARAQPDKIDH